MGVVEAMGFVEDTLAAPRPVRRLARALRVSKFGMWVQVRRWCSSTDPDPAMSGQ